MSNIEMEDLRARSPPQATIPPSQEAAPQPNVQEETISLWTWVTASILVLLSLVLTLSPRLLLFAAETATAGERRASLTPLESFLALHFGLWLLAISGTLVLNVPSTEYLPPLATQQTTAPSHPLLGPLTVTSLLSAFLSYNTTSVGPLSSIVFVGSATIGLWGLWAVMFASTSRISKKTGADKHTSAFLFGNKSAASAQKKEWKKEKKFQNK